MLYKKIYCLYIIFFLFFLSGCIYQKKVIVENQKNIDLYNNIYTFYKDSKKNFQINKDWIFELSSKDDEKFILNFAILAWDKNEIGSPIKQLSETRQIANVKLTFLKDSDEKNTIILIEAIGSLYDFSYAEEFCDYIEKELKSKIIYIEQTQKEVTSNLSKKNINIEEFNAKFKKQNIYQDNITDQKQPNENFYPVIGISAEKAEQIAQNNLIDPKKILTNEEQFGLFEYYTSIPFSNKNNKRLFQFNVLKPLIYFGAGYVGSIAYHISKGESLDSVNQTTQGLFYLMPLWIPYLCFHVNGDYKYQSYPFEQDTGFLLRSGNKDWMLNTGFSFLPANSLLGLDAELFYGQFGLSTKIESCQNWKKGSIAAIYHFARNDFFNFQFGLGYGYFNSEQSGLDIQYGADMFYHPLHLFYHFAYSTTLYREIAQGYDLGFGIPIHRYEVQILYQSILRTYANQQDTGIKLGLKTWF